MRTKLASVSLAVACLAALPLTFASSAAASVGRLVCEAYVDELAADAARSGLGLEARQNVADWVDVTLVQCRGDSSDAALANVRMVRERYGLPHDGQVTVVPSESRDLLDLD